MGEEIDKKGGCDIVKQETLNDDALMLAISSGEVSGLEEIYDRYSRFLFPLCRRILKDEHTAQEVLQDVFMEVWRLPWRFNPGRGSLIVYLTHLTRSRAIDRWRKDRKVRRDCLIDSELGRLMTPASPAKNEPPHMAELREQIARMKSVLGQLSALHRVPIELAFIDGLSHSEIAAVLSIPLGTIKARIRSGLIHLRQAFQTPEVEDEYGYPVAHAREYGSCASYVA